MARPSDPNLKIDLLRAAEAVFVERGLDNAKIQEITARAGHSKGSFYLHFKTKEDAFRELIESMLARLESLLADSELFSTDIGPAGAPQLLELWVEADVEIFEFIWLNRRVVRMVMEGGKCAQFAYLIDDFLERSRQNTVRFLTWGMEQGIFRPDLDVEVTSIAMAGAYDAVARHVVKSARKPDLRALVGKLQQVLYSGVMTDHKVSHARRSRSS